MAQYNRKQQLCVSQKTSIVRIPQKAATVSNSNRERGREKERKRERGRGEREREKEENLRLEES
jgi:hypothetical protein